MARWKNWNCKESKLMEAFMDTKDINDQSYDHCEPKKSVHVVPLPQVTYGHVWTRMSESCEVEIRSRKLLNKALSVKCTLPKELFAAVKVCPIMSSCKPANIWQKDDLEDVPSEYHSNQHFIKLTIKSKQTRTDTTIESFSESVLVWLPNWCKASTLFNRIRCFMEQNVNRV